MSIRLKDLTNVLATNYIAGVNTMLFGKPGIGKTATIEAFVVKMKTKFPDFQLWPFYAPTMSPMDIQASAPDNESGLLRIYNNAALPNAYTHPEAVGAVFIGEFLSADTATAKLLQKYVNGEDMSGTLRKPAGVVIIGDSNRIEDKSGVQQQGRALMSRFEQHDVYSEAQDNMDFAARNGWHPAVQTFFKDNPTLIDNYDEVFETSESARARSKEAKNANGRDKMSEEGKRGVWASMRSWDRISKKEFAAEALGRKLVLSELIGNLGNGAALAYETHKAMLSTLTSFEDIIANPKDAPMPAKIDEQYALCMILSVKATTEDLDAVAVFGKRMTLELQATLLRQLASRKNFNLAGSAAYTKWIADPKLIGILQGKV